MEIPGGVGSMGEVPVRENVSTCTLLQRAKIILKPSANFARALKALKAYRNPTCPRKTISRKRPETNCKVSKAQSFFSPGSSVGLRVRKFN